jgi:uncharacterized protein YndB with AHSA1/START domain
MVMGRRIRLDGTARGEQMSGVSNPSKQAFAMSIAQTLPPGERELVITRVFDAPRELVWKAWTDPSRAIAWWGPRAYPATSMQMDVRVGGTWRMCLTSVEDGRELWQHGEFREVEEPERLAFTFVWEEEGERGIENLVTIDFEDRGGKTLMTFRHAPFLSAGERDGHAGGWSSTFDRLADLLAQ